MPDTICASTLEKFTTFGDLLRYLRRRAGITQLELSIGVGYSSSQISRLEQNLRLPDPSVIEARFAPALYLEDEPMAVARLMELAATAKREDAPALGMCPYKGLDYFDETDADLFVGREALTEKLAGRILALVSRAQENQNRFFAIVGASGSGKSSLVRAGLVPTLRWNKTSANWPIHVITPANHPLESLAISLAGEKGSFAAIAALMDDLARDQRTLSLYIKQELKTIGGNFFLLVVDQFEELYALCRSDDERSAFIDNLITATFGGVGGAVIVITLRADFYTHCAKYLTLREALATHQEYIGVMNDEEIRRAIEEPARRGHWEFENGLVDLILHDVGHEPGALPLLSHAMFETWQRRHGHTLTLSGYTSAGGVRGAIAETAEAVFTDQFNPAQQVIARRIFLRLTELGDEIATSDTHRRATINELILKPEESDATQVVLKALADARLITTSEDAVQVAHEALIREWPTLRGWLEDNREGLRLHRQLTESAKEWLVGEHEPDILFRTSRLAQAREWAATHSDDMNALEIEFLETSVAFSEKEAAEREDRRQRELEAAQKLADTERQRAEEGIISARRLRRRSILGTAGITLAVLLAIFAMFIWGQSAANAAHSHSVSLASAARQANQSGRVDLGLALALEAVNLDQPPIEAVAALREVALGYGTRAVLDGYGQAVRAIAISPDAKTAFSGSCAQMNADGVCMVGELTLWDLRALKELHRWSAHSGWVTAVAFSLDGQTLISGADDGSLYLWDVNGGQKRQLVGHTASITDMAIVPTTGFLLTGSADGQIILWELRTGTIVQSYNQTSSPVTAISVYASKLTVVSAHQDGSLWLWSLYKSQLIQHFENQGAGIDSVAISPDGSWILIAESVPPDLYIRKIDVLTGTLLNQLMFGCMPGHLALSPDASYALVTCQSTIYQVDLQNWVLQRNFSESSAFINAITISQYGSLALSASEDGSMRLWNLGNPLIPQIKNVKVDILNAIAISPNGERLMVNDSRENGIEQPGLWDIAHNTIIREYSGFVGVVSPGAVAFSSDNRFVAAAGWLVDKKANTSTTPIVMVWYTDIGDIHCRLDAYLAPGRAVAFSPDSLYLLAGSQDPVTRSGQLILWDVKTCQRVHQFDTTEDVTSIAFSTDGTRAITGSGYYGRVILWDVATGKEIRRFLYADYGPVLSVAFGPADDTILASGSADLYLWDVNTGNILRRYSGLSTTPYSVAISPDGKYVLAGSMGGEVILLEFATWEELHRFEANQEVYSVLFSPDGKTAFAASRDGKLITWQITEKSLSELQDWISSNRYVRPLTCAEKQQYLIPDSTCK
jgi:WD40 repeat protein/transcriptional regulator with XRE-family HTH domain